MWQLTELQATNICAFEQLTYTPVQNQATLVFGNNLDNDSQNSNGSGKSALIEAVAIGILGEPLRKVNVDEIINDHFDEATVSMTLHNTMSGVFMTVNRKLSRKSPQDIQVIVDGSDVKQSSVADYNKYVLEQIGLSKDDVLHNFILTARKYQSFLSSSDKDKKEIINRFSNGVMVDESIEALRADIEPLQLSLQEAENEVARCTGRVSALAEEIESYIENEAAAKASLAERIASIQESISSKRAEIRDSQSRKTAMDQFWHCLDGVDADMQKLEESDADVIKAYTEITNRFLKAKLPPISDYEVQIERGQKQCDELGEEMREINDKIATLSKKAVVLEKELFAIKESNQKECNDIDQQSRKIENEIVRLRNKAIKLRDESSELMKARSTFSQSIATLEKQLAGVIECPKCHHEFTLANDMDVAKARMELVQNKTSLKETEADIDKVDKEYDRCVNNGKAKKNEQAELDGKKQDLVQTYNEANAKFMNVQSSCLSLKNDLGKVKNKLQTASTAIANMRKKMFDEAFDIIDKAFKDNEWNVDGLEKRILAAQSSIEAFEEQIKQLKTPSQNNGLEHLKESKVKYERGLEKAKANQEAVQTDLNILKTQESNFVEFKTYLANTKIKAIAQITNDFLDAIGSDIRVNLSGYTVLKSGKVRDKISVSLIRNGIDCGSFDKFSAGEKCRVELASVLALHKLSNVNCEEGKGLNLLVIDEILDCTDEEGLANVFKALNDTQVTALVVSHGNIAENYPNRLIVTKQNGVSTINEESKQ